MILVDTSILVDYLRQPSDEILNLFQTQKSTICGVIRAEVLAGVRDDREAEKVAHALDIFESIPIPETVWDIVGRNAALLRCQGIAVPFADMLIATLAIENKLTLWTKDLHFLRIRNILPTLALFSPPLTKPR
jgi:predicted nucleic acid-binding protein